MYAVEYTFADGTKLFMDGRCMVGCYQLHSSYAHGTKGSAIVSSWGDCGSPSRLFKGQNQKRSDIIWESKIPAGQTSPYENEWTDLVEAIRGDKPYNEVKSGVEASVVSNMGRKAAHTGREITFEEMLNCDQEYAPDVDKFTMNSSAPVQAGPDGKYPVPQPGIITKQEYWMGP